MRLIRILAILYRDFIVYNLVFTFLAGYILYAYGRFGIPGAFWTKVLGFGLLGAGYYFNRRHRFYFYHNLGISRNQLVWYAVSIDTVISLFIFYLIYVFT